MESFKPEKLPELIELNETECCALSHGFDNNIGAAGQLANIVGKEKMGSYISELRHTESLGVLPNEETKMVYSQIAKMELKNLKKENRKFACGHSADDHKSALESVVEKFSPVEN